MSFPHENQIEAPDQFWCSVCGHMGVGKLGVHVGNDPAGSQRTLSAVCAPCNKRAKAARRDTGESRRPARPAFPSLRFKRSPEAPITKINRRTADYRSNATVHRLDSQLASGRRGGILRIDLLTEALIATVKHGRRTVSHLKEQLEDGLAYVKDKGAHNVEPELLMIVKALDAAIQRIEIELACADRRRDN